MSTSNIVTIEILFKNKFSVEIRTNEGVCYDGVLEVSFIKIRNFL